jgi:hypothetical protein
MPPTADLVLQLLAAPVNAQLGSSAAAPAASIAASSSLSSSRPNAFGASLPAASSSPVQNSDEQRWLCAAAAGGDGGGGGGAGGGSGGSGGGGGGGDDEDGEEYLDLSQAQEMAAAKGMSLPDDFLAAAGPGGGGLRRSTLEGFLRLAGGGWLTSLLVRSAPIFRDRLIADRLFFFKVGAEVLIDSGGCGAAGIGEDSSPWRLQHAPARPLPAHSSVSRCLAAAYTAALPRSSSHISLHGRARTTKHATDPPARPQAAPRWRSCASAATTSGASLSSTCQTCWWGW